MFVAARVTISDCSVTVVASSDLTKAIKNYAPLHGRRIEFASILEVNAIKVTLRPNDVLIIKDDSKSDSMWSEFDIIETTIDSWISKTTSVFALKEIARWSLQFTGPVSFII